MARSHKRTQNQQPWRLQKPLADLAARDSNEGDTRLLVTDLPGNDEPGNDEPGNDEPGNDEPGNDEPVE